MGRYVEELAFVKLNRRDFVRTAAVAGAALAGQVVLPAAERSPFGICLYSFMATRKFRDTLDFVDQCHAMGAAGVQTTLTSPDRQFAEKVRAKVAGYGMFYEGITSLPKEDGAKFEQDLIAAKAAGATVVRSACLSGRRYETFATLAEWQQFVEASHRSIALAVPLLEKHRIGLAIENHKDWTVDEMVALLEKHSSEFLGVCLDFGNNLSLLDSPDAVMKLAPWAISTHVKDIGLEASPDGFLMAEVPIGQGVVDVARIMGAIRSARPQTRGVFEMITRDPLPIPCLTDKYWATFPDRNGMYLAKSMRLVRERGKGQLTRVSSQPPEEQARLADANLRLCLDAAREQFPG